MVLHALGIPEPLEIEKKYLVSGFSLSGIPTAEIDIEQQYIRYQQDLTRIHKRGQHGHFVYYATHKQDIRPGIRQEIEKIITHREYESFARRYQYPLRAIIRKKRHYFLWQNQYFELDVFTELEWVRGLCVLEIELDNVNQSVDLPPFIDITREVTDDLTFTNASLAKKSRT